MRTTTMRSKTVRAVVTIGVLLVACSNEDVPGVMPTLGTGGGDESGGGDDESGSDSGPQPENAVSVKKVAA